MDDTASASLLDALQAVFRRALRRRWLALGVAWVVALASGVVVPMVPQRYEATARVFVDTQSVLKPLMSGLAYQPDLDQQVRMLAQTVITRPNLERMFAQDPLGMKIDTPADREATITRVMGQIKLTLAEAGLYAISYRDTDPQRARRVVEATVEMFVRASAGDKMRDSEDARRFIDEQIGSYEAKLVDAESRLKEFKIRNFGVTGASNQDFFARMSTVSDELKRQQSDLRAAEQSRDAYRRELLAEDPQLPSDYAPPGMPPPKPPQSEVEVAVLSQKKVLDELLRRFTDQHPDVIAARHLMGTLEAQSRREREAAGEGGRRGAAATSPVYQRIRVSLAEAEAQVASLRSRVALDQQRLDELRSLAGKVPQVEADFAQLNRDYDVIRKNYEQLVSRREAAAMGVKLEESSQLTNFRVVEPARVLPRPVFPGQVPLALAAVLVSVLAGLLAPTLVDWMRPTLADTRALREFTKRPVIGMVSIWKRDGDTGRQRRRTAWQVMAAASLLLMQGAWLGWIALQRLA